MADQLSPGQIEEQQLRAGGFDDAKITQWRAETTQILIDGGMSGKQVDEYFGVKEPDMAPVREYVKSGLAKATQDAEGKAKPASNFLEALQAGFQMGVVPLAARGRKPDVMLPEDSPWFYGIASQMGTLAGDIPAMVSGGVAGALTGAAAGGAAGTATLPVVGTVGGAAGGASVGAAAGAFALPAAMREILMQHYDKGDVKDFGDFWQRSSAVAWEAIKGGATGAATSMAGGAAGKLLAGVSPALRAGGATAAEIVTMVSVGKALEGEVPEPQDFLNAAVLVGGLHMSTRVAGKIRQVYAKTGLKPEQVAELAQKDPAIMQDLLSENIEVPKAFEAARDPDATPVMQKPVEVDKKLATKSEVFGDFGREEQTKTVPLPKEEPVKVEAEFSDAEKKILDRIGEPAKKEKASYTIDQLYTDTVDKYDPIKRAVKALSGEGLADIEDGYKLARMSDDYKAKAIYFYEKGVLDYDNLKVVSKPLKQILEPIGKDKDKFQLYLVSKRALEIEAQGKKSGVDLDAARQVVKDGKKQFEQASNELVEYQNSVLKYLADSGYLTKDSYNRLVETNKAYIPFFRLDEENFPKGKRKSADPIKALKGSDAKISNPLEAVLENTPYFLKLAERNRAVVEIVKAQEKSPDNVLIERVGGREAAKSSEPEALLKEHGVEGVKDLEPFKSNKKQLLENEFEVWRDGKREVWAAKDVELAKAIKRLDGDAGTSNMLFKFAASVSNVLKLGVSFTPEFIIKNNIRDQMTRGVFSKYKAIPFYDSLVAMKSLWTKDESYWNWMKSGGASGAFLELDSRYFADNVYKLSKETGLMDKVWNVVKTPVDMMRVAGMLAEQSTRLAEFKRASGGLTTPEALARGGFAARESTVDFQRMGAKMKALNAITAFQNVGIQGIDRTARAFKEDPAGMGVRAFGAITVPSVLLWWANKDDERVKEVPRWQKDMFWIIATDKWEAVQKPEDAAGLPDYLIRNRNGRIEVNNGTLYRIPKPQELGLLFGSLPERALEAFFTENPNAFKEFSATVTDSLIPSVVPNVVSPVVETYFNKSMFTGHAIIPASLEKFSEFPEYQYTEYTSQTAKILGKMVATVPGAKNSKLASPVVLDSLIQAWSGSVGRYAVQVADQLLTKSGVVSEPPQPIATLADIPFIKAFVVRYPSATAQSIQDFYSKNAEHTRVVEGLRKLAKDGRFESYQTEVTAPNNEARMLTLSGIQEALANQNKYIRLVYANPDMKPEEKRQIIDGIYFGMIEQAKAGNEILNSFSKKK